MDWRALEEHFRIAATQEPGPFGDEAIEWDYSRYARGLGLTGEPGAHDLPHRGCAVVALPAARWDVAEKRFRGWAEQRGWDLWRFSARPTAAVPDPVTYALGTRAAGPDSLLFARAAVPVRPAMGNRPRSEGMSFPLTPGERWLIATDRVRRRMRAEIAMRGLVLFVEEAEWLTPAGLAVLMYLLDAHRAWRARMLARPARVYVVLATAPEHEGSVVRMLGRFHLNGHPPVVRERKREERGAGGPPAPLLRDVEDEYLFGALAASPAALAEEDVRSVFGASAVERCRAMVERGLLRARTEAGLVCYAPNPAVPAEAAAAPRRALLAVAAVCRRRARRGHEHLGLVAAGLALALEQPHRAEAAVARMPHTAGTMLPLRVFEEMDAALERARPRLRADHVAAWFSLAAHQRAYDHARELAHLATERELRTWKEMHRLVRVVLCTGRTHLDTCLPGDFWPKLKSRPLAGPFIDATCVLAELFWRKRYLDNSDIRQRYEFACECFARTAAERPQSTSFARLDRIARLIIYRAALHLDVPSTILRSTCARDASEPVMLRTFLREHQLPAFLAAAPAFAEAATGQSCMPRSMHGSDRLFAVGLGATTGQPADLAVTTAVTVRCLLERGLRILLRELADDLLVLLPRRANPSDRHDLGRILLGMTGVRGRLMGANAINLEHGRQDVPGHDAFDELAVAKILMSFGDLAGARDRLMVGFERHSRCQFLSAMLLVAHVVLARRSLDVALVNAAHALVDVHAHDLGPSVRQYLHRFVDASKAVCAHNFDDAGRLFAAAQKEIRGTVEWARDLKYIAIRSSRYAQYTAQVLKTFAAGTPRRRDLWRAVRFLCSGRDWRRSPLEIRTRVATCLDYLWPVLDTWAHKQDDGEEVLRVVLFLKESVDAAFRPLGSDYLSLMATWAPRLYERVRTEICERVGDLGVGAPEARLAASLRTLEEAWREPSAERRDERVAQVVFRAQSAARQAKRLDALWHEDATTFAKVWASRAPGRVRQGAQSFVAYGYGRRLGAKPVATRLNVHVEKSKRGGTEIRVDARAFKRRSTKRRHDDGHANKRVFIGSSEAATRIRSLVVVAARCRYPTLVLGETGVGKELVARCIHAASAQRHMRMVVAECASTVEGLLETELFGHEKGAFTGAQATHEGLFQRADGSSLLLDELDSMPPRMQAALLRVLETGEYRPVGARASRTSEFRVIGAGLPRLLAMVDAGSFRRDLFYRISTLRIEIPPLRERGGDSEEIAVAYAQSLRVRLTAGALRAVREYEWPGNVRQLRHCIQAAGLHAAHGCIGEAAMSEAIGTYRTGSCSREERQQDGREAAWTRALRTLERTKRFGAWDYAQAAELSRRSAQRHIAHLLRKGRIIRIGVGRATQYSLRL